MLKVMLLAAALAVKTVPEEGAVRTILEPEVLAKCQKIEIVGAAHRKTEQGDEFVVFINCYIVAGDDI